jgi:mycothiol synthase
MDASRFRLRPHTDEDFDAEAALRIRSGTDHPLTGAELRERDARFIVPPSILRRWVVETGSPARMVGLGIALTPPGGVASARYEVAVVVDPEYEHQGIGRALADWVEARAGELGARTLLADTRADRPRALEFLRVRGYREVNRHRCSRLDLRPLDPSSLTDDAALLAREGLAVRSWAELGHGDSDVLRRIVDLNLELSRDVPRTTPFDPVEFREFLERHLTQPDILPDGFFVAEAAGELVGLSYGTRVRTDPSLLQHQMTGTVRAWRRRGVALALKRRTIRYAIERGYSYMRTYNDVSNAPILALNQRLGFAPLYDFVGLERPVA